MYGLISSSYDVFDHYYFLIWKVLHHLAILQVGKNYISVNFGQNLEDQLSLLKEAFLPEEGKFLGRLYPLYKSSGD
jgi:hypothetical protein